MAGLSREAKLAPSPDVVCVLSGGSPALLRARLSQQKESPFGAVLSFGIAGGLDPALLPGDVVVAEAVSAAGKRWPADPRLVSALTDALRGPGRRILRAATAGSEAPLFTTEEKRRLHAATGAAAVDMESHVAADFAAERGLPFAAIRVICDPAERSLPPLVAAALKPDGSVDLAAVAASLIRHPGQLGALIRLAGDSRAAFRSLRRCGDLLRVRGGAANLVQLVGDVA